MPQKAASKKAPKKQLKISEQISRIASKRFGIEEFRPGQEELILAALSGRDSLCVMPTGSGKSLCFQVPSLLMKGSVIVVSPLISLMKDQHDKLIDLGIPTAQLNSTNSTGEETEIRASILHGEKDLIYVTPERLENKEYLQVLKKSEVSLVVIDEAHCISQWGHDFRPAYTNLASAIKELGRPPVMALTATATEDVTDDILKQLQLESPLIIRRSIDRPNLVFSVSNTVNEQSKHEQMLQLINECRGSGIVYTSTVKAAEEVSQWLISQNVDCRAYHGKLPAKQRQSLQEQFMNGEVKIIVATKAFGLGIDNPDIRLVLHYQFPDSVESYYQEAGRAGRDGGAAQAVLLYQLEDKRIQSYFLTGKYPSHSDVSSFLRSLQEARESNEKLNLKELAQLSGTALNKLRVIANHLESAGIIKKSRGIKVLREFDSDSELETYLIEFEARHQTDRDRLQEIQHYAQTMQCRVIFLRNYFGEAGKSACGKCDNCNSSPEDVLTA